MTGRKHERVYKIEPIDIEPVSHDFPLVLLAKTAEVLRVNQLSPESVGSDDPALQPSSVDPLLYFTWPYVQRFS